MEHGNIDFVTAIDGLKEKNTYIMLVLLECSTSIFYDHAKLTWFWSSEDPKKDAATMSL